MQLALVVILGKQQMGPGLAILANMIAVVDRGVQLQIEPPRLGVTLIVLEPFALRNT